MGYTTDFDGKFVLNKPLSNEMYNYLAKFNESRRMARKLPAKYGVEGEFFVGGGFMGQDQDDNIISYNSPPKTQPSLWCQWRPTVDRLHIEWDEGEKFYHYKEWIVYLIHKILAPAGYVLNGDVMYYGEDSGDRGVIRIKDNVVYTAGKNRPDQLFECPMFDQTTFTMEQLMLSDSNNEHGQEKED
jgi:hypothetical protein